MNTEPRPFDPADHWSDNAAIIYCTAEDAMMVVATDQESFFKKLQEGIDQGILPIADLTINVSGTLVCLDNAAEARNIGGLWSTKLYM